MYNLKIEWLFYKGDQVKHGFKHPNPPYFYLTNFAFCAVVGKRVILPGYLKPPNSISIYQTPRNGRPKSCSPRSRGHLLEIDNGENEKTGTKFLRLEMDQAKMNENENLKPREILILPKVKFQKLCTPPQNGPQASA